MIEVTNGILYSDAGVKVPDLCREHGISSTAFYEWRPKLGGMDTSMIKGLKELEDENRRLKKMYAEERLKSELRRESLEGKGEGRLTAVRWSEKRWHQGVFASALRARRSQSVRPVTATNPSLVREKPEPRAVPQAMNHFWSMDFMHDHSL